MLFHKTKPFIKSKQLYFVISCPRKIFSKTQNPTTIGGVDHPTNTPFTRVALAYSVNIGHKQPKLRSYPSDVKVNSVMELSIGRDKGNKLQSLSIDLAQARLASHVVEGIMVPIFSNRTKAEGENIMTRE